MWLTCLFDVCATSLLVPSALCFLEQLTMVKLRSSSEKFYPRLLPLSGERIKEMECLWFKVF